MAYNIALIALNAAVLVTGTTKQTACSLNMHGLLVTILC